MTDTDAMAAFMQERLDEEEKTAAGLLSVVRKLDEINNRRAPDVRQGTHVYDASIWALNRVLADVTAKRARLKEFATWQRKLNDLEQRPDAYSPGNRGEILGMWMASNRAVEHDAAVYADHPAYQRQWSKP